MAELPEQLHDRHILVTGGAGFIGSHLTKALVDQNEVVVLDNLSTGVRENVPDGAELVVGDIRDETLVSELVSEVDLIFHQAAMVDVDVSIEEPIECMAINCTGTLNVLEAVRIHGGKLVFASSAAVYGDPESLPIAESARKSPKSPYGLSKLMGDLAIQQYAELYGCDAVALRYFNVYGPGQTGGSYSGVIETFLTQASEARPLTVHGDGRQTRDFVYVEDVVRANILAAAIGDTGESYNVGTGSECSISDLAELIGDLFQLNSEIRRTDGRSNDIVRSCANLKKATSEVGYEPTVDLRKGIEQMIEEDKRPFSTTDC